MKTEHCVSVLSAVVAALSSCPSAARADPALPPATSYAACSADDGSTSVSGTTSCAIDHSVGSITTSPVVSMSAQAAYVFGTPASSSAFVTLTYNFAVVGGTKDTVVPVDIDSVLRQLTFSAGSSPAYAFAQFDVNTPRSSTSVAICSFGCGDSATSLDSRLQVDALAGETSGNTINLEIEAQAAGYASIPSNSSIATIDPHLYVDPGFAGASGYAIVLSDGIGNGVSAVPEPGAPMSMLAGLGLLGLALGRRSAVR